MFSKFEKEIKETLDIKYTIPPAINWDIVGKGAFILPNNVRYTQENTVCLVEDLQEASHVSLLSPYS